MLRRAGLPEWLAAAGVHVADYGDLPVVRWRPDPHQRRPHNLQAVLDVLRQTSRRVGEILADVQAASSLRTHPPAQVAGPKAQAPVAASPTKPASHDFAEALIVGLRSWQAAVGALAIVGWVAGTPPAVSRDGQLLLTHLCLEVQLSTI